MRYLVFLLLAACATTTSRPQIDATIAEAIAEKKIPGGVIWIEQDGRVYSRAYGDRAVVPAVEKKYFTTIKTGRENRALLGASLGGITSFHTALKYPEVFSKVGGQSSSFCVDNERVVKELEKLDASKNKFTFYIDDGTLEGVEDSRKVVKLLKDKGFDVTYAETEAGHNWTAWRDRLADAFMAIWK